MKQHSSGVFKSFLLCFFLLFGANSCDDEYVSVIPYVTVNMNINPTNFIEFNIPGGSYYFGNYG